MDRKNILTALNVRKLKAHRNTPGLTPRALELINEALAYAKTERVFGSRSKFAPIRAAHRLAWRIRHEWPIRLDPRPYYYIIDERDCDHYRVIEAIRARNGNQYLNQRAEAFSGSEGPTRIQRCTRLEWQNFKRVERDYVLEAHESGNPYSVGY